MNSKNGGNPSLFKTGTAYAEYQASPTTGQRKKPRFREYIMTYTANNFRNALFAVSFALISSILLVAGTISAPLVA